MHCLLLNRSINFFCYTTTQKLLGKPLMCSSKFLLTKTLSSCKMFSDFIKCFTPRQSAQLYFQKLCQSVRHSRYPPTNIMLPTSLNLPSRQLKISSLPSKLTTCDPWKCHSFTWHFQNSQQHTGQQQYEMGNTMH